VAATRKMIMMRQAMDEPGGGDAESWPGVASRALDAATEDWRKLARLCVLLTFVTLALTAGGWLWVR
jgi:hypothetical protein